ncbi:hypothetical protein [Undibacterium sp. RuRC25W]|uniref:hypothetical protein n=1 Tax=Undibacterium sp. RuRC25W TaxID=3413047 RepID=UPI003BF278F7
MIKKSNWTIFRTVIFAMMGLLTANVYADGVGDLKTALGRLQGSTALKAVLEAKSWNRQGEGKKAEEMQANASVTIEDTTRGLQVLYSKELLSRLQAEERAKERDPNTKMPVTNTLKEFNSTELRPLVSAASNLSHRLETAVFKTEKTDILNGKSTRLLTFDIPVEHLSEKERKYLKTYEGKLEVWIDSDGTPLASRTSESMKGSAFVVISFEAKEDESLVYGVSGDRLIILKKESKNVSSGAGERNEIRVVKTLQVQA